MLRLLLILAAALGAAIINAQSTPTIVNLDSASAVQRALHGNLDLRAARFSIEQARARIIDAGAWENPSLNATGASDFAFGDEGEHGWTIGLEQKFPITDRLQHLETIAGLEVKLAELEVRNAERELAFEVERTMESIHAINGELSLLREQLALNQQFADFLAKKIDRAEASPLDLGQASVAMAALNQRVLKLEREKTKLIFLLREQLGIDADVTIEISPTPAEYADKDLPTYDVEQQLAQHPAVQLRKLMASIATEETELARAKRWGDIAVELFYEEGLANNALEDPFTGNIRVGPERERFLGIGVSIPLPLHNRNRGEIISRQARVRQLETQVDAVRLRLVNEAKSIEREFESAQAQVESFEEVVLTQARDNLSQLENAYSVGQVDLTAVFRAQESLLELRLEFDELTEELHRLKTRWRYVTGNNLPETLTPTSDEE